MVDHAGYHQNAVNSGIVVVAVVWVRMASYTGTRLRSCNINLTLFSFFRGVTKSGEICCRFLPTALAVRYDA